MVRCQSFGVQWFGPLEGAFMRSYVKSTGVVFGLLTLVHIWRVIEEGSRLAKDPWFVVMTILPTVFCLWAFRLVWLSRGRKA